MRIFVVACLLLITNLVVAESEQPLTPSNVLAAAQENDWRTVKQSQLLYLQLEQGEVIFEMAPGFAPEHIDNLRTLVEANYFDGLAIIRSQDNYVVQWGDPQADSDQAKSLDDAALKLAPEFFAYRDKLNLQTIDSRDAYANQVGFVDGFAVAVEDKRVWLTHCYGALGVGRGMEADSGNASQLYVVTGHAPRHLDRNVTLIGRALLGMQYLTSLPRGTGALGFYETPEEYVQIKSIRFGDQLPKDQQQPLQVMRTESETFNNYVQSRTHRLDEWFIHPAGKIEVCNVGVPVRATDDN